MAHMFGVRGFCGIANVSVEVLQNAYCIVMDTGSSPSGATKYL
jgi:hypothetical protein